MNRLRTCAGHHRGERCAETRLPTQAVRDPAQTGGASAADAAAHRAVGRRAATRPDRVQFRQGRHQPGPGCDPSVALDPVEVVKRIETAGAWMVLKRIENSPEYRRLIEDALLSVARARNFTSLRDAGFEQIEGFLFVSSPNSTTPFHLDSEDNSSFRSTAKNSSRFTTTATAVWRLRTKSSVQ